MSPPPPAYHQLDVGFQRGQRCGGGISEQVQLVFGVDNGFLGKLVVRIGLPGMNKVSLGQAPVSTCRGVLKLVTNPVIFRKKPLKCDILTEFGWPDGRVAGRLVWTLKLGSALLLVM